MKNLFFVFLMAQIFHPSLHAVAASREVELTQDFQPKVTEGVADLYIPLPLQEAPFQKIQKESHESNANWVKVESVQTPSAGDAVRVLHAHWDHADHPSLKLHELLTLSDQTTPMKEDKIDPFYLQPTEHVQIDGIVHETSTRITKNLSDPDQKAEAIFNWVVENSFRDPKTRGCGLGDVKSMLKSGNLGGKCADLNSLFVGLARASGVPAREVWGLRVAQSNRSKSLGKEGDVSKSQHCRAEYYSDLKKAWVPVDPADIRKVILEENLSLSDPHIKEIRPQFFGSWEGNWVAFNRGRDFKLTNDKKLNFLMYPQLVSSGLNPDGADPTEVSYTFISKVISQK